MQLRRREADRPPTTFLDDQPGVGWNALVDAVEGSTFCTILKFCCGADHATSVGNKIGNDEHAAVVQRSFRRGRTGDVWYLVPTSVF